MQANSKAQIVRNIIVAAQNANASVDDMIAEVIAKVGFKRQLARVYVLENIVRVAKQATKQAVAVKQQTEAVAETQQTATKTLDAAMVELAKECGAIATTLEEALQQVPTRINGKFIAKAQREQMAQELLAQYAL